ncbi:MAG TPA: glycine zipper 2TM domain-containing protein [Sphingobium sp.]
MNKATIATLMLALCAPVAMPSAALAQDHGDRRWDGDRDSDWDPANHYEDGRRYRERRMRDDDRVYRGSDGRYYCKRNDGTTGLVIGGVAGGVLGNVIGGGTLGTLLGAGGGALLGRSVDRNKQKTKCR